MPTAPFKVSKELRQQFPQVNKVQDAKANVVVQVTPDDCTVGVKKKNTECALAKACKRQLDIDGVCINLAYSYLIVGKKAIRYVTSERVKRELVSFDRSKTFAIGEYLLRRPSPSQRLGAGRRGSDKPKKKKRSISISHHTEGVRYLKAYNK